MSEKIVQLNEEVIKILIYRYLLSFSPLLSGNIHKYRSSSRGVAALETALRGRSDR